jgi:hypothetical protein
MTDKQTSKTRAWWFPTSPRSPYKIRPELTFLKQVEHLAWRPGAGFGQRAFAELLSNSKDYEGEVSGTYSDFAARDRTRGPKILGLIKASGSGATASMKLTAAGERFLNLSPDQEEAFFLNQIAKVQFPSAVHAQKDFPELNCRPLTISLEILLQVGSVTKEEFGLFVITCIQPTQTRASVKALQEFRAALKGAKPGLPRKELKERLINERVAFVYQDDILAGATGLREGGKNFIATKRQTLAQDYADAAIRYLITTGLFRIDPHGKTFSIVESKRSQAKSLIEDLGLGSSYSSWEPETYVDEYLGNLNQPEMSAFTLPKQIERIQAALDADVWTKPTVEEVISELKIEASGFERQLIVEKYTKFQIDAKIAEQQNNLATNRDAVTDEILEMFKDIQDNRSGLVDKPLFFEWNTWRAFTALNDAIAVTGNFRCDSEGNPLGTASGKQADIVAEYEEFWLAIEVTLQSGHKQYEAEAEPISRHVGSLQRDRRAAGDSRPVYGIFIAPRINETVLNYLMTVGKMNSKVYSGPVQIAPLNLDAFQAFVLKNQKNGSTNSSRMLEALEESFDTKGFKAGDEPGWFEEVADKFKELSLA